MNKKKQPKESMNKEDIIKHSKYYNSQTERARKGQEIMDEKLLTVVELHAKLAEEGSMKLFLLTQKQYYDFRQPDAVNTMLVRAENELEARTFANVNEYENRDSAQMWSIEFADCEELTIDGLHGVILVS